MEVYAKLSFLNQEDQINRLLFDSSKKGAEEFLNTLLLEDQDEQIHRFSQILNTQTAIVKERLSTMSKDHQSEGVEEAQPFEWTVNYRQDHFYMRIVHDLIDKISLGEYPLNHFLPSERKLTEYYHVGLSTVRSALSLLNKLGYAETINGKGTRVMLQDEETAHKCMRDRLLRQNTLLYLNALQLLIIVLPQASRMCFDSIEETTKQYLIEQSFKQDHIFIDDLYQCLIDHLSLQPYREIFIQLREICRYGYYYSFFEKGIKSEIVVADKSKKALQFLLKGQKEAFTWELTECFKYILEFVREHIVYYGLLEAKKIKIPLIR